MSLSMQDIIVFYQKGERVFNPIIFLCYLVTVAVLLLMYPILGWIVFYIPTIIFLWLNYKKMFVIGKYWLSVLLGLGVMFFICNIFAEKTLNDKFDIEASYLNYSTTIYAVIIVASVISGLIFLRYYVPYLLRSMVYLVVGLFSARYRKEANKLNFLFALFIMIGLFYPVIYVLAFAENLTPYYVMMDSYTVSDCGPKIEGVSYIRKNSNECYFIDLKDWSNLSLQVINSPIDK